MRQRGVRCAEPLCIVDHEVYLAVASSLPATKGSGSGSRRKISLALLGLVLYSTTFVLNVLHGLFLSDASVHAATMALHRQQLVVNDGPLYGHNEHKEISLNKPLPVQPIEIRTDKNASIHGVAMTLEHHQLVVNDAPLDGNNEHKEMSLDKPLPFELIETLNKSAMAVEVDDAPPDGREDRNEINLTEPLPPELVETRMDKSPMFRLRNHDFYLSNSAHRGGWMSVIQGLASNGFVSLNMSSATPETVELVDSIEEWFSWRERGAIHEPWAGFAHLVMGSELPSHITHDKYNMLESTIEAQSFRDSARSCVALFVFTTRIATQLSTLLRSVGLPDIAVCALHHPFGTEADVATFDPAVDLPAALSNSSALVLLGQQYRRIASLHKLQTSRAKIWLPGHFDLDYSLTRTNHELHAENYGWDPTVQFQRVDNYNDYDRLVRQNIVIIDLWAAAANNAILEGAALQAPFLVRKLDGPVEYLGAEYPLFFETLDEVQHLLDHEDLLRQKMLEAHLYLKQRDVSMYSIEHLGRQMTQCAKSAPPALPVRSSLARSLGENDEHKEMSLDKPLPLELAETLMSKSAFAVEVDDAPPDGNEDRNEINLGEPLPPGLVETRIHRSPMFRLRNQDFYLSNSAHRGGWMSVIQGLATGGFVSLNMSSATPETVELVDSIEEWFAWSERGAILEPWVGFAHLVMGSELPSHITHDKYNMLEDTIESQSFFRDSAHTCVALFVFTTRVATQLSTLLRSVGLPDIAVCALHHPFGTEADVATFDPAVDLPAAFSNSSALVLLGQQYRRIASLHKLQTSRAKIWLPGHFDLNYSLSRTNHELHAENYGWDPTVQFQRVDNYNDYDRLVRQNIVIIDLWAAAANNAILEGAALQAPFLIRKLDGPVEYLGAEYPLFFDTLVEVQYLLDHEDVLRQKMLEAHLYLKQRDVSMYSIDHLGRQMTQCARNAPRFRAPSPASNEQ
jgi:hypothetical protein